LLDSREHKIANCNKAIEIWNTLRRLSNLVPLQSNDPDLIKEVLGQKNPIASEIVINAEILSILSNPREQRILTIPSAIIVRIILRKLYNLEKGQCKENIKTLLDKIGD
jgi:uncharacterized membrane protein